MNYNANGGSFLRPVDVPICRSGMGVEAQAWHRAGFRSFCPDTRHRAREVVRRRGIRRTGWLVHGVVHETGHPDIIFEVTRDKQQACAGHRRRRWPGSMAAWGNSGYCPSVSDSAFGRRRHRAGIGRQRSRVGQELRVVAVPDPRLARRPCHRVRSRFARIASANRACRRPAWSGRRSGPAGAPGSGRPDRWAS